MSRIDQLKAFLLESPEDPFLQHALALEHIKSGELLQARILFEQLLQQTPTYVGSYYHLAKLLEQLGHTQEALAVYDKGLAQAKLAGDQHAWSELNSAREELAFE